MLKQDLENIKVDIRRQVLGFLLFMTSDECRQAFYRYIPAARFNFELCRSWFEDIYTPGIRYLTTLKGDYSEEEARQFRACFSEAEFKYMERFHRFFELRIDMLTETDKEQALFPAGDSWQHILKDAGYLAETLEPDARKREEILAEMMERIVKQRGQPGAQHWQKILKSSENS